MQYFTPTESKVVAPGLLGEWTANTTEESSRWKKDLGREYDLYWEYRLYDSLLFFQDKVKITPSGVGYRNFNLKIVLI